MLGAGFTARRCGVWRCFAGYGDAWNSWFGGREMNVTHNVHPGAKMTTLEERIVLLQEQIAQKQDQIEILKWEISGGNDHND